MKQLIKLTIIALVVCFSNATIAQTEESDSEIAKITATLMDYIEGTGNGEPDRLRKAFHLDFNLYTVIPQDSLWVRSGEKYISNMKEGKKTSRIDVLSLSTTKKMRPSPKQKFLFLTGVYLSITFYS